MYTILLIPFSSCLYYHVVLMSIFFCFSAFLLWRNDASLQYHSIAHLT
jgi:hypothetical protein